MKDYRDNLTLDEIADNDLEMTKDAVKNAKRYTFWNPQEAIRFMGRAIGDTLVYLGIENSLKMTPQMLDRIEKTYKIKIERRNRYKDPETWRNGIYIYKDGVIVAFISEVFTPKISPLAISQRPDRWYVITNAKLRG